MSECGYTQRPSSRSSSRIQTSGDEDIPTSKDVEDLDYCRNVYFEAFRPDEAVEKHIGVVVGSGYGWTWSMGERRMGTKEQPIAVETVFGWALMGPKKSDNPNSFCCHHVSAHFASHCNRDDEISKMIASQFEPVDEGKNEMSVEDKFAISRA